MTTNSITEYYATATKWVTTASVLPFSGFAVNNFVQGRIFMGCVSFVVITVLVMNAILVHRGRYSPMLVFCVQVPVVIIFISSVFLRQGVIGAFWSAPALLSLYFMLPERLAWAANLILLIVASVSASLVLEPPIAFRVAATLTLSSVFSAIFVRIINLQQDQLRELANTDPLTGLRNRMLLIEILERAIAASERNGEPMTLMALDLDHFKDVNDAHGHDVGDQVLIGVADVLRSRLRKCDQVFRTGGEEFLALLHESSREHGQEIAEQIRREISDKFAASAWPVTVSVGVATAKVGESGRSWMRRADENLYRAKAKGRDRMEGSLIQPGLSPQLATE